LQFAALLMPILAAYPLAAASAERATRDVIEQEYAPATQEAQQPDRLRSELAAASADIDAIGELPDLLREAGTSVNSTKLAFHIWNRSSLSVNRVTSQIELYGPSSELVSHFSMNVPEFGSLSRTAEQKWAGTGCEWDAFAEVARFGAGERRMLQAERALCGAAGEYLGAVTIRIIPDYRTLPFVTSANPYYDALGTDEAQDGGSRVPEFQVVVYGWGLQPAFVSGRVIWPVDDELFARLYASRDPFWIDRELEGRTYHVYFLNDRGGIYALGIQGRHCCSMRRGLRNPRRSCFCCLRRIWRPPSRSRRSCAAARPRSAGCLRKSARASTASSSCFSSWPPWAPWSFSRSRSART
jgi:hypothetical protein